MRSTKNVSGEAHDEVNLARFAGGTLAAVAALALAASAHAQAKKIKIGVVYDLTGPFAAAAPSCSTKAPRS